MSQEAKTAPDAPSAEYPIRALVKADASAYPANGLGCGEVISVRKVQSSRHSVEGFEAWGALDNANLFFVPEELVLNPSDAQIAEERQKAGLPALESAPADPEPVRAEGPDPLVKELVTALEATLEGLRLLRDALPLKDTANSHQMILTVGSHARAALSRAGGIRG